MRLQHAALGSPPHSHSVQSSATYPLNNHLKRTWPFITSEFVLHVNPIWWIVAGRFWNRWNFRLRVSFEHQENKNTLHCPGRFFFGTGGSLAGADGRSGNDQRRTWSIPRAPHSLHQSAELAEGAESCSFLPIGEIILRLCNTQSSICRPAHDFHSPPPTYTCIYQHTFNFALRIFLSNKR